jgi:hypothetical protein
MPNTARRRARRPAGTRRQKKRVVEKPEDTAPIVAEECEEEPEVRARDVPLPTQQIRHAMAEIRAANAKRTAPILSRRLETVGMTVADFCFRVVLQMHKKRRVGNN